MSDTKHTRFIHFIFFTCIVFVASNLFVATKAYAADTLAIFTFSPELKQLSKSKARLLFRGKMKLVQGKKVELSDLPQNNPVRNDFYQELLGKDMAQMNAYWASLSFSGKARPPKQMETDSMEELALWMSSKRFRIGYAPIEQLPENANVLYVVKKEKQ